MYSSQATHVDDSSGQSDRLLIMCQGEWAQTRRQDTGVDTTSISIITNTIWCLSQYMWLLKATFDTDISCDR